MSSRFEVSTAIFFRIQVFQDVTLCHRIRISRHVGGVFGNVEKY